ncbi:MAG: anti-sigma factor [Planctomycetota bacterium]
MSIGDKPSGDDMNRTQLRELIAGHLLDDLSQDEDAHLRQQATKEEFAEEVAQMERTVAAVATAFALSDETNMPSKVRERIKLDGQAYRRVHHEIASTVASTSSADRNQTSSNRRRDPIADQSARPRERLAWVVAAAASLLAFVSYAIHRENPSKLIAEKPPISLVERREAFLEANPFAIRADWSAGTHPFADSVEGGVVWDTKSQNGFMRFVGLPVNNPNEEQYQLWIIDPQRDDEPIDGGVFDSNSAGELVIPIDAKLVVVDPQAFAVTIEKPGGVVVSTQERLPLLAPVGR